MTAVVHPDGSVYVSVEFVDLEQDITTVSVAAVPAGLTFVGSPAVDNSADPRVVSVRIADPQHGIGYQVTITATLSDGTVEPRVVPVAGFNG